MMKCLRLLAVAAALMLGACADFSAVRDISTKLSTSSKEWDEVAAELKNSCERERQISKFRIGMDCADDIDANIKGIRAANKVVRIYFDALADIANDENFKVDEKKKKEFKDAVDNVKEIKASPKYKAVADAAQGFGDAIIKVFIDLKREQLLRNTVDGGAQPTIDVLVALHAFAADAIGSRLKAEQSVLGNRYFADLKVVRVQKIRTEDVRNAKEGTSTLNVFEEVNLITALDDAGIKIDTSKEAVEKFVCEKALPNLTNATAILLINDYCKRKALLETKLASTVEFKTTVDAAIEALKELKSSKIDLSARETATKLYKIGKDLDDKIEAFRKSIK